MAGIEEKRVNFRRHSDRRIALLLAVHEALFDFDPGTARDERVLGAVRHNFAADGCAFAHFAKTPDRGVFVTAAAGEGNWHEGLRGRRIDGLGVRTLLALHEEAPGALTLTHVKRPSLFPAEAWDDLWQVVLAASAVSLLSVRIAPDRAPRSLLWIGQQSYSREWGSGDRDLAEEVARLLGRAADKQIQK